MSRLSLKALQAAAGAAAGEAVYVDDVFSTFVRTGTGGSPTIVNNIDLAGEGGLVWVKSRSQSYDHNLFDTERGASKKLVTNSSDAEGTISGVTAFNSNGFTLGDSPNVDWNDSSFTYCYWTFRKAPKFFDVVTYTGNGVAGREIAHNLDGTVGSIFIKELTQADYRWMVYHISLGNEGLLRLDSTGAATFNNSSSFNSTTPTSSVFTLGDSAYVNGTGKEYVAYLFAHNDGDGEFGESGDQDIIKCGSYTGDGVSGKEINVGFEPQWILQKASDTGNPWTIIDVMRGANGQAARSLQPNSTSDEQTVGQYNPAAIQVTATGFKLMTDDEGGGNGNGNNYIYIAIRRPHKPASEFAATDLFDITLTSQDSTAVQTSLNRTDVNIQKERSGATYWFAQSRLTGNVKHLRPNATTAESDYATADPRGVFDTQGKVRGYTSSSNVILSWMRAPGFFDVVAWTGDSVGAYVDHNLGVAPEMIWVKNRDTVYEWGVYHKDIHDNKTKNLELQTNSAEKTEYGYWFGSQVPTETGLPVGLRTDSSNTKYIAYLFASVPGVSKVGSYTGTGSNLDVNCGFTSGARFVLVKRTDSTGDWYVWDSERGIVAGNDPYLLINSAADEVTSTDYIDPLSSGFTVTSSAPAALNASGGTYIFLAIA